MGKPWKQRPYDKAAEQGLIASGYSPVLSRLLSQRGITKDNVWQFISAAEQYLSPTADLAGVRKASTILLQASLKGESVSVIGDYDVDGVLSSAMMKIICDRLGLPFRVFLPSRFDHGYGLNEKTVASFLKESAGNLPDILVTCDCGSSSEQWIRQFKQAGIHKVIVIDHHIVDDANFSRSADAVVNWRLGGSEMCAAGLVYFLARALKEVGADVDTKELEAFAAIATVADVTPVKGDNRIIVRNGLQSLADAPTVGISVLAVNCGLNHKHLTQEDVAFKIAPRLNAPGRMSHCKLSYDLVVDPEYITAMEKAKEVDDLNKDRRAVQQLIEQSCIEKISSQPFKNGILVMDKGWNPGIVGIVAAGISRKYGVPCILLGEQNDRLKGSGRSVSGINIKAIMDRCSHIFESYGGHEAAAGAVLKQEYRKDAQSIFDEACCAHCRENPSTPEDSLYDIELTPAEINKDVALEIAAKMHPYCEDGNPEPVFMIRGVVIDNVTVKEGADWRLVTFTGSQGGQKIPMRLKCFSDEYSDSMVGSTVDVVFSFPQKFDPRWGMDLNVVDISGG